jgi:transcriptional regulator with XRE-family HTH domain
MSSSKADLRTFAILFGKAVKDARETVDISQTALASRLGTTRSAVAKIETGVATYLPALRVLEVCEALELDINIVWAQVRETQLIAVTDPHQKFIQ